jgi:hypothetical protein
MTIDVTEFINRHNSGFIVLCVEFSDPEHLECKGHRKTYISLAGVAQEFEHDGQKRILLVGESYIGQSLNPMRNWSPCDQASTLRLVEWAQGIGLKFMYDSASKPKVVRGWDFSDPRAYVTFQQGSNTITMSFDPKNLKNDGVELFNEQLKTAMVG